MVAENGSAAPMRLVISGASPLEIMTMFAVLRDHVGMEITRGETRESYLFVRGAFIGTPRALDSLRALLSERDVEVTLVTADSLAGLYGRQVSAMEIVLDYSTGTLAA